MLQNVLKNAMRLATGDPVNSNTIANESNHFIIIGMYISNGLKCNPFGSNVISFMFDG